MEKQNELPAKIWSVLQDLPAFLTSPLFRPWHLRWGATDAEVTLLMPGDELLPDAQYRTTRAITINAPPAAVWPWLVQAGGGRAGFYSNDLLDNLGRSSATAIMPALQHLEVGQWVPLSPSGVPTPQTAFRVHSFVAEQWLLWAKPDSTWAWRLKALPGGGTRVVMRIHAFYDWSRPLSALLGVVFMEFGDFAMLRRMLRGIKARAEAVNANSNA